MALIKLKNCFFCSILCIDLFDDCTDRVDAVFSLEERNPKCATGHSFRWLGCCELGIGMDVHCTHLRLLIALYNASEAISSKEGCGRS